jgi:hypothetical protein
MVEISVSEVNPEVVRPAEDDLVQRDDHQDATRKECLSGVTHNPWRMFHGWTKPTYITDLEQKKGEHFIHSITPELKAKN